MNDLQKQILELKKECEHHLNEELLPFWISRTLDKTHGGLITHFDKDGKDTGEDEKSMLGQARSIYVYSSAYRNGYGGEETALLAKSGVDFLIDKMWDPVFGGFFWMTNRAGEVIIAEKILYGHSFAMYSLSEYTLATGDLRGVEYAEKVFELIQKYCADTHYGGYFEMFHRNWELKGPGAPTFAVIAARDPKNANLDRVQIVKGWLNNEGHAEEKVYNVAWSGERQLDPDGSLPPVGNTVDLTTGKTDNRIGAPELSAVWSDPEFDENLPAFYYVRVL